MKMTMHIDDSLLSEVMKITGAESKTAAVDLALRKIARKHKFREAWKKGLGLTPEELANAYDPVVASFVLGETPMKSRKS